MNIYRATLEDCKQITGTVVVIDVIRAFTTAAVAFSKGALEINLVGEVSEALAMRERLVGSKVMGELGGVKPVEFDYSNSPSELFEADLAGLRIIQRTTAGTQGVIRCTKANKLIAGSFINAKATAQYIRNQNSSDLTFVITGNHSGYDGAEDFAYADYMEELLQGIEPDPAPFISAVQNSTLGKCIGDPKRPEFPLADLDFVLDCNRFNFALPIIRKNGQCVMTKVNI